LFYVCILFNVTFSEIHSLLQLQDLGSTLIELWNLMGTPVDERRCFDHATSLINVSQNTGMPHGCLAHDLIEKVTIFFPFPLTSPQCQFLKLCQFMYIIILSFDIGLD
jgi:hypothetical protein